MIGKNLKIGLPFSVSSQECSFALAPDDLKVVLIRLSVGGFQDVEFGAFFHFCAFPAALELCVNAAFLNFAVGCSAAGSAALLASEPYHGSQS